MTDRPKRIRPAPVSLRLKQGDRARLESAAGEMSLNAYMRWRLLEADLPPPKPRRKPRADVQLLSQALGRLGESRIRNNLNQIAKAGHLGDFDLGADRLAQLDEALEYISEIRSLIIAAIGLSEGAE